MDFELEAAPETISKYVNCDTKDNEIVISVSENHRGNYEIQQYVQLIKKRNTCKVETIFLHLDEITKLNNVSVHNETPFNNNIQKKVIEYFRKGVKADASDIHMTIGRDGSEFCYIENRVYGELRKVDCIDKEDGLIMAGAILQGLCDVTESQFDPNKPQDARLAEKFLKEQGLFGARYAHTPAVGGLYVVMRLIKDDSGKVPTFEELGFLPQQIAVLKKILMRSEGIAVWSGPTGSGKSTTLRCAAEFYLKTMGYSEKLPLKRLTTIEDPPEGRILGAIQTVLNENSIKYMLRLDPDCILNGEMRDNASALAAIKAAQTGHLVLSTVHANDPIAIIDRLEVEGIPLRLITNPQLFIGLISQRLVQKLCPKCHIPYSEMREQLNDEDRELIETHCDPQRVYLRNREGCEECSLGIIGRTVVAEVISPDAKFFRLYNESGAAAAKTYWHRQLGGVTRNQHVLHYINNGLVDPLAANLICPLDEDKYMLLPV